MTLEGWKHLSGPLWQAEVAVDVGAAPSNSGLHLAVLLRFLLDKFATTAATAGISPASVDGVNRRSNMVIYADISLNCKFERARKHLSLTRKLDQSLLEYSRVRQNAGSHPL